MSQDELEAGGTVVHTTAELDAAVEAWVAPAVDPVVAAVEVKPVRTWWQVTSRGRAIWCGPAWDGTEAAAMASKAYCLNEPSRFKLTSEPIEKPKKGVNYALGRRGT